MFAPHLVFAQKTWTGNDGQGWWNWNNNWNPWGAPSSSSTQDLIFSGGNFLQNTNNIGAWSDFRNITFTNTSGSFTLKGDQIDLFGKIENNDSETQTVEFTFSLNSASASEINPTLGNLNINSTDIFNNGNQLNVYGNNGHTLTFGTGTTISGGGAFSINQNSTVVFQSAHTYSGDTFVNAGTLRFTGSGKAGNSDIRLGDTTGTTAAKIQIASGVTLDTTNSKVLVIRSGSSGTKTIESTATTGTATLSRNTFLDADLTTLSASGGTLLISSSTFDLKNQTLTVTGAGNTTISSVITNDGGSGKITKNDGGVLTISNDNKQGGTTTLNAGTLRIGNNNSLGTGGFTINGGTFASDGSTARTITNAITMGGNVALGEAATGTGALTLNGTVNLGGANRTFTIDNNSTTLGGIVSNGALTKAGSGTLTLTGANSYTSGTLISAGTLQLGNGGTTGSLSTGNITNNATFLINRSDNITLNNAISGASGVVTKTGTGTLTLGGANTFGGALTIAQGAISAAANNNLGGGSAMTISNAAKLITTGSFTSTRALTIGTGGGEINVATSTVFSNTGAVSGSTALTKTGSGTLALSNASSSYSGTIGVTAGTLQVNGTATSMDVNVTNSGSVLMGAGSIGDVTVNNGAFIAPGNSVGNLSVSSLTLEGGGGYNWEITAATGTAGTNWDLITVGGGSGTVTNNATSGNPFTIFMQGNPSGWDVTNSYSWTIIDAGTITGFATNAFAVNFSGFTGATPTGTFSFSNVSGDLIMAYTAPDTTYNVTVGANTAADQGSAQATNSVAQFTGAAALNKLGAGTLIMTNPANNYSGVTTVKEGTLQINVNAPNSAAGALGTASSAVVVGDTAAAAAAGFNFGVAGITNARGLSVVAGTGSADRIIGTTITSGVAEQSGTVAVNTNTVFQAAGGGTLLVSGAISGAGNITISNSGLNIFSGVNTYSGTTTILTNSTLRIANNDALGTTAGATTVNGGGTLALSNNISSAEGITINGSGVSSAGAIRNISGNNTLSGGIVLGSASRINADTGTTLTLSGGVTGAGQALTLGGAGNITVSTTGINTTTSGSLTIDSTGVVTLGASGNYTGTTTLSSGTLRIGNNSALGTGGFTINGGVVASDGGTARTVTNAITLGNNVQFGDATGTGGLTFSNINLGTSTRTLTVSNSTTVAGAITNTGGLTKAGSGTLILSGANTYTGATTLNAGVLQLSGGSAISDANALTLNGGTLVLTATETVGSITGAGNISLEGNQLIAGGNDSSTTFSGVMSSSGSGASFVKAGTGTTTFSGANTMNGQLYIDAGTLRFDLAQGANFTNTINVGMTSGSVAATLAIGASGVTVANPITVRANSGVMTISALNTSGTATFSGTTTLSNAVTLSANAGGNLSLGAVAMGNNNITYSGSNNVTIGGTMTATTGAAELRVNGSGTLTLSGNNSSGNFMKIILNNGTLSVGSLNAFGQTGDFYGDKINFNGGTLAVTENVTIDGGTFGMTTSANGGTIDVASNRTFTQNAFVAGNASGTFNKTGAGTLILGDSGNVLNPTFNIQNGTVQVGSIGALGANVTAIGLGSASTSGTLRYTGSSGSFSDNITVGAAGGTIDVTVASLGTTLTNSGIISGGALTKAGDSILVLSGANTYGKSVISGGMLTVGADNNLGATPGSATADSITIGNGRLGLNGNFTVTANRGVTLTSANSTIDVYGGNSATVAGIIASSGAGALTKLGSGTLTLTGGNTYSNGTIVGVGVLRATAANSLGSADTAVTVSNGATLELSNATGFTMNRGLTLSGNGANGGALVSSAGANTNSGGILLATNARIAVTGGSLLLSGNITNGGNLLSLDTFGVTGTPLTIGGAISGAGALEKIGGGTAVLSGANSYNGTTLISAGALQVGNGGGTGQLGAGNVTNNSSLVFNRTGELTVGNNISGTGSLTKQAAGTVTLSGNNTYSGATTIAGGTLRISGNNRLGNTNTTLTISNAGVLDVTAAGTITNAITIGAGNGVLGNSSGGQVVFAGAASKNGTVLTSRSGSGTNVFTGVISGASANSDFIVDGGTTVFSNQMTYNGPTIITNGGTLVLGTNNATPSASGLVLGGGTLLIGNATTRYSTTFASLTLTANSTIDMGANGGLGTLTFGNSSLITWTGTLTITNWQGVAQTQSDVTKLLFGVGGLSSTQLGQIYFANQNINGGELIGGELVPVPEPRVYAAAVALLAAVGWRERKRLRVLIAKGLRRRS